MLRFFLFHKTGNAIKAEHEEHEGYEGHEG